MTNAKQEFLNVTGGNRKLLCATIMIQHDWDSNTTFNLKPGYTQQEYDEFVQNLDFMYDSGYGTQHLFGTIWFEDSWLTRHEYDGAECWELHKYPEIPALDQWGPAVDVFVEQPDYGDDEQITHP